MTKIYKLLIESPEYLNGTEARWNDIDNRYDIYSPDGVLDETASYITQMQSWNVENRPNIWELQEYKLDLRSPEAEKMREEARSKRWEFMPNDSDRYYMYSLDDCFVCDQIMTTHDSHYGRWNMGNCHRTKEEALAWGKKYARYFLTE